MQWLGKATALVVGTTRLSRSSAEATRPIAAADATRGAAKPAASAREAVPAKRAPTRSKSFSTPPFVQITDAPTFRGDGDGPSWIYANRTLMIKWAHPGGDWRDREDVAQGANHYATASANGVGDIVVDVTSLVARLRARNTGIYLRYLAGNAWLASKAHATARGPRLHVVTSEGEFDPACVADTYLSASTVTPLGAEPGMQSPALLKFDLSSVSGALSSATLTLAVTYLYAPCRIAIDYLDCPAVAIPNRVNAVEGIAAKVARDRDLANHPGVLLYDDLVSADYVRTNFQGIAPGKDATEPAGCPTEVIDWPQYGLKALRCWRDPPASRLISWHHWAEPKQNPSKRWQRDFGDGWEHLFCRYLLEIGEDVFLYMTEAGMKIPGMAGTYNWSTSGARTLPEPRSDGTWEARLWHSGVSKAHPHVYGTMVYLYAAEHPLSIHSGQGTTANPMRGLLKAGQVISIEQEVKVNTFTNGAPNRDGVIRVWFDGVLVFERTDVYLRKYENVRIQSIPWVDIYHGGMGIPSGPFHYDIGGICVATEYIGPPRLLAASSKAQSIDSFDADSASIAAGSLVTLSWATSNASRVWLDGERVSPRGIREAKPLTDRTYTLEAEGATGTVSQSVSVAIAQSAGKELPSWVPPIGKFAEFTLNTPASVGAPKMILANWTGGTFVDDFGTAGGAVYHGGGEHFSWNDRGGVLVLDCAARKYVMRCVPSNEDHWGVAGAVLPDGRNNLTGSETNEWGDYADDDTPQSKHTYNGVVPFPKAWGGGPQGGLIRIQSGGQLRRVVQMTDMQGRPVFKDDGTPAIQTHGFASAHAFDLSQKRDGQRRLSGKIDLGSGRPAITNDSPGCGIDYLREGWWMFARGGAGAGDRMAFIHKSGQVTSPATSAISLPWGRLHHFADDDTLCVIAGKQGEGARNIVALCHPGPTNPWKEVQLTGSESDLALFRVRYSGYIGFQWSAILNCFVGIHAWQLSTDMSQVGVWKVVQPDTAAKRWTEPWRVELEVVKSADGSQIDMLTDHAVNAGNGLSYGKLVECKKLRSLVWTRRTDKPGQLIRLRGM
jgi:hypothetical protein